MTFFLKILNESRSRALLRVNGASGMLYGFKWDAKLRAYTYMPTKQADVDDLFKTMRRSTAYVFVPVAIEAKPVNPDNLAVTSSDLAQSIVETVTIPVEAPKPPLPDKLVEMALFRGVIVTEDDSEETVNRLIAAYDKGAAAALNSVPAKARKPRQAKPKPHAETPPA
jgi:hypothetical protein